jgi:hypothetical protein
MIDVQTLNLASISWGILLIAFSLAIIAGKITFSKKK